MDKIALLLPGAWCLSQPQGWPDPGGEWVRPGHLRVNDRSNPWARIAEIIDKETGCSLSNWRWAIVLMNWLSYKGRVTPSPRRTTTTAGIAQRQLVLSVSFYVSSEGCVNNTGTLTIQPWTYLGRVLPRTQGRSGSFNPGVLSFEAPDCLRQRSASFM